MYEHLYHCPQARRRQHHPWLGGRMFNWEAFPHAWCVTRKHACRHTGIETVCEVMLEYMHHANASYSFKYICTEFTHELHLLGKLCLTFPTIPLEQNKKMSANILNSNIYLNCIKNRYSNVKINILYYMCSRCYLPLLLGNIDWSIAMFYGLLFLYIRPLLSGG